MASVLPELLLVFLEAPVSGFHREAKLSLLIVR